MGWGPEIADLDLLSPEVDPILQDVAAEAHVVTTAALAVTGKDLDTTCSLLHTVTHPLLPTTRKRSGSARPCPIAARSPASALSDGHRKPTSPRSMPRVGAIPTMA